MTKVHPQYDKREISYAATFTNPVQAGVIRTMEWMTGKVALLKMVRKYEALGPVEGRDFFVEALKIMGIDVQTPADELDRIPATGPVVVVANHPHGLVDGMVLAHMFGRVRNDYKILARSLLTEVEGLEPYLIPVPFPHEPGAREASLAMRKVARRHLDDGGLLALFPAGVVASSSSWLGPAIEQDWNAFTGKLCKREGATVVPVYFPGQNSRAYQVANKVSSTARQGLLLHEVVHACGVPQRPVVGEPISPSAITAFGGSNVELARYLRQTTLALASAS